MEAKEMKDKYRNLYNTMATSRKVENMKLFGAAFTDMFGKVADSHPEVAAETLATLAGIDYNNYLTEKEALGILSGLMNQDGTSGAKWSPEVLEKFLQDNGLDGEEAGEFNFYALAVVMNMIYSDYYIQLAQMLGEKKEELPFWIYRLSVAKLHDKDRSSWLRDYFLQ